MQNMFLTVLQRFCRAAGQPPWWFELWIFAQVKAGFKLNYNILYRYISLNSEIIYSANSLVFDFDGIHLADVWQLSLTISMGNLSAFPCLRSPAPNPDLWLDNVINISK